MITGMLDVSINKRDLDPTQRLGPVELRHGKDVSDESIADAKRLLNVHWYNGSFLKVPVWE